MCFTLGSLHFARFIRIICVILTTKYFFLPNIAPHRDASLDIGGMAPSNLRFDSKLRRLLASRTSMLTAMKVFTLSIGLSGSQIRSASLDEEKCLCPL